MSRLNRLLKHINIFDKRNRNHLLYYISYYLRLENPINKPFVIDIETTNMCNARCIMCPRSNMKRPIKFLEWRTFKKIIDEAYPYTEKVLLHMFGEPLLHKDLIKMIKYCKTKGIPEVLISTNGMFLTEKISRKIINSGLDTLIICLDGNTKETHEKIRPNTNYDVIVKNIEKYVKILGQKKKPKTILQFIEMKENKHEVDDFIYRWSKFDNLIINIKICETWAGTVKGHELVKIENEKFPCPKLWYSISIFSDGSIGICCRDYDKFVVVGDAKKERIYDVWHSKKMKTLRKFHIEKQFEKISLCKDCIEWYWEKHPHIVEIRKNVIKST